MMGRGGRTLVLLCCCTTLLLISSSAVSGQRRAQDESLHDFGRFAGRFEREHLERETRADDDHTAYHVERPESLVVDEKKPAEEILEKARSFLSGLWNPLGNGIPNPASSPFHKKKWARAEAWVAEARRAEEEKAFETRHFFGPHRRSGHSHLAEMRDLVNNDPERLATAANVYPTEPFAKAGADNIDGIVWKVVTEAQAVEADVASTCAGTLEVEVRSLVRSLKSALREDLCKSMKDALSMKEQTFCNHFIDHPKIATFEAFAKNEVNPIDVSLRKLQKTSDCRSRESFSDFFDSMTVIEAVAGTVPVDEDQYMEDEDLMFHRHGHEHGDHERHWWQRIWHKHGDMKPHHHFDDGLLRRDEKHRVPEEDSELRPHGHEDKDHERHWWQRIFGMFHEHNHKRHHGKDCFRRKVNHLGKRIGHHDFATCQSATKHLGKRIRHHIFASCKSTTDPDVIFACKFAREHRFLVKAWLYVWIPVNLPPRICRHPHSVENEVRHPPIDVMDHVDTVETPVYTEDSFVNMNGPQLKFDGDNGAFSRWFTEQCAKLHAKQEFSKALQLRGHVIGISSSNNAEIGLPGIVRMRLIVTRGLPLHLHQFEDAIENIRPLDQVSSEEMFSHLQERLTELVREVESSEDQTEQSVDTGRMVFNPFPNHVSGPHFSISANPDRAMPVAEDLHFRISSMPRVVGEFNNETPMSEIVDGETESTGMESSEVELQSKTGKDTAEDRAAM